MAAILLVAGVVAWPASVFARRRVQSAPVACFSGLSHAGVASSGRKLVAKVSESCGRGKELWGLVTVCVKGSGAGT